MKYLTLFISLILLMITAQPGWAQQQDTLKDSTSMHNMEMIQDSTTQGNMMGMCMNMMNNMESDTTRSGNMMGGDMSGMCMKMCMNMMDMDHMDMENMPENKDSHDSTQREKSRD